ARGRRGRLARRPDRRPCTTVAAALPLGLPALPGTAHRVVPPPLGPVSGSAAHARASLRRRRPGATHATPARHGLPIAAGSPGDRPLERLRRGARPRCRRRLVRRACPRTNDSGTAGTRDLLPALPARDARLRAAAQLEPAEACAAGRAADPA